MQKESFATRLRAVREARHYTLQEMADLLGTSKQVDLLYLLGESDTLQPPQTGQPDQEILQLFSQLPPEKQEEILDYIRYKLSRP